MDEKTWLKLLADVKKQGHIGLVCADVYFDDTTQVVRSMGELIPTVLTGPKHATFTISLKVKLNA